MTRLEKHQSRQARRQKRSQLLKHIPLARRSRRYSSSHSPYFSNTKMRPHHSYNQSPQGPAPASTPQTRGRLFWKRSNSHQKNPVEAHLRNNLSSQKPPVDTITAKAFQTVIVDHLLDQSPCSLRDILSVLRHSHWVAAVYQSQSTMPHEHAKSSASFSSLSWFHSLFGRSSSSTSASVYKNYEFIQCLARLEDQLKPQLTHNTIRSWENARELLAHVFEFLPEHSPAELAEHASIQHVRQLTQQLQVQQQQDTAQRRLISKLQHITLATTSPEILADAIHQGTHLDPADALFCGRLAQQYDHVMEQVRINQQAHRVEQEMRQQEQAEREKREQAEKARQDASQLLRPLTPEEDMLVEEALYHAGPSEEIVASDGADTVQRGSLQRLLPGQWLNDEVIHYYMNVLAARDAQLCQSQPGRPRSHFFKSFFVSKLLNDGHRTKAGEYEYKNVKRWSKKVPGKDLFALDKVCFPINQGGMHWVCAVIFIQERKICFYDSLGSSGQDYLEALFQYVQDEHQDKKKAPLPDVDAWELVPCDPATTPRQLNGYDCGVFTCMFLDFVSKDCPLVFGQDHITQCRQRIALSILQGTAIM